MWPMRHAMSSVIAAALLLLTACAAAPTKKAATVQCNDAPQWTMKAADGRALGIFVCFSDDNHLLYTTRALPVPPAPEAGAKPGRWDRPECQYFRPEAQERFCRWLEDGHVDSPAVVTTSSVPAHGAPPAPPAKKRKRHAGAK